MWSTASSCRSWDHPAAARRQPSRLIAGFERPDAGRVRIAGDDVTGLPAYKRPVNTVFQSYALFPISRSSTTSPTASSNVDSLAPIGDAGARHARPRPSAGGRAAAAARALGRATAACRPRPCARHVSQGAAPRRAAGRARPQGAEGSPDRAQADPGVCGDHVHLRHPRSGGSAGDVRSRGGDERRPHRAAGAAAGDLRPPGNGVRRRLHRRHELHPSTATAGSRCDPRAFESSARRRRNSGHVVARMVVGPAVQCVVRLDDGQEVVGTDAALSRIARARRSPQATGSV